MFKGSYDATYTYYTKDFANGTLIRHTSWCTIIGETEKSYKIRLVEAIYNRFPDEIMWVRKKSICRSYLNNETKICDIYKISPAENSCRTCLQDCDRRNRLNKINKVF